MSFNNFDFSFDTDYMKQDLNRADRKPGEMDKDRYNKYVVFPKGECVFSLRILPADTPRGRRLPYATSRLHYINGRGYHCLNELIDGRWRGQCPICEQWSKFYKLRDAAKTKDEAEAIEALAREIKPVDRNYYNCIQRKFVHPETGAIEHNKGPLILAVGKSLHAKVLRAFLGNEKFGEAPLGNIAHPFTGRDFKYIKEIKKGKDAFPNYDSSRFEEESVLGTEQQIEQWLSNLWDLEAERNDNLKTVDELREQVDIFLGKKSDPAVGFEVSEADLPVGFAHRSTTTSVHVPVAVPAAKETVRTAMSRPTPQPQRPVAPPKQETKAVDDIPFDIDLDSVGVDVGDDWVANLQNAINMDS